jgi:5'(3')-deoxyribonucleotidase
MDMMNKPIIYFDMDGVLADIDTGMMAFTGHHIDEFTRSEFFDEHLPAYVRHQGFLTQPAMEGAKELVEEVFDFSKSKGYNVGILTSIGHFFEPGSEVAHQKKRWLELHFPIFDRCPFTVTTGGLEKAAFAHSRAFLIDDHPKNIKNFMKKGGYGIEYYPSVRTEVIPRIVRDIL